MIPKETGTKQHALLSLVLAGVYAFLAMWILFAHWPAPPTPAVVVPPASLVPCMSTPASFDTPATILPASAPATVIAPV